MPEGPPVCLDPGPCNTISSHLRSIYAKLQVHSRVTLLLALQAASRTDDHEPVVDHPGVTRLSSGVHGLTQRPDHRPVGAAHHARTDPFAPLSVSLVSM